MLSASVIGSAEISLYRIVPEWTNNVLKYSNATKIAIQLVGHEDEISVTVEDGDGFDPSVLGKGEGNGWKNIQSRLNLVKGELMIDSAVERRSSSFILRMPLVSREVTQQNQIE